MTLRPRAFSSWIRCVTLCVRRRAAEGRAGRRPSRRRARRRASRPATAQRRRMRLLGRGSTLGVSVHCCRAQIVAEPCDHERDAFEIRAARLQLVERRLESDAACATWRFSAANCPGPISRIDGRRLVAELGRAGDQRDRAHHVLEPPDRAHHLERELRNAVAEIGERQPLEHDVGEPAIGRRVACAFARDDQRIGRLRLAAGVDAIVEAGEVEQLAVGPDAPDAADRPFAQADREVGEVAVGRRAGRRLRPQPLPPPSVSLCVETTSSSLVAQITWPASRARP